jgi:hypothetical protein
VCPCLYPPRQTREEKKGERNKKRGGKREQGKEGTRNSKFFPKLSGKSFYISILIIL